MEADGEIDDTEILKRKIAVVDKLLKHKDKLEGQKAQLTTENMLKDNIIQSLQVEITELKSSLEDKTVRLESLEKDKRNQSLRFGQLESTLAKKNCELINKDLELNDLKRQIENLETENSGLNDRIKNDKASKQLRDLYEAEKWKNLAEISNLKQQSEALKARAKEKEELSNAFRVDLADFERVKKENTAMRKEMDENKKDKLILTLNRKLEKALTEIRKLSKGLNDAELVEYEVVSAPASVSNLVPYTASTRRFQILNFNRRKIRPVNRVQFRKLGSLLYAEIPNLLYKKPVISESSPFNAGKGLETDIEQFFLPEKPQQKTKRKADKEFSSPRKKWKGQSQSNTEALEMSPIGLPKISVRQNLSNIRVLSSISSDIQAIMSMSFESMSFESEDNTPLSSSTPTRRTEENSGNNCSIPEASRPSAPVIVQEHGSKSLYFEPNPLKNRVAHRLNQREPKSKPSVKPKSPKHSKNRKSVILPSSERPDGLPVSSARAKILGSGLTIETPSSVGKNLTEEQKAAAKNRMVGRAPPGVASRPSVDGFRSSERTVKSVQSKGLPPKQKPKVVVESDFSCPSRRKTMPSKMGFQPKPAHEYTEVSVVSEADMASNAHETVQDSKTPKTSSATNNPSLVDPKRIKVQSSSAIKFGMKDNTSENQIESQDDSYISLSIDSDFEQAKQEDIRSSLDDDLDLSDDSDDNDFEETSKPAKPAIHNITDLRPETIEDSSPMDYEAEEEDTEHVLNKLQTPASILLKEIQYRNLLDQLLGNYNARTKKQNRSLEHLRAKVQEKRKTLEYQTFTAILEKSIKSLQGSLSQDGLTKLCDELCQGDSTDLKQQMFCDYIYNFAMSEHKSVQLLSEISPDSPPVTRNQQRIFTLITHLQQRPQFVGVIDRFLDLLYHGFYGVDRMFSMSMSGVLSLGRLLVLCARHMDDLDLMKRFLFDLFFFKSPRNHLLVRVIMDLWPEVLEKPSTGFTPEQETIIWSIFNTGDLKSTSEMKVHLARLELQTRHGYNPYEFDAKAMVMKYLEQVENKASNPALLNGIKYALLLLGRGHEYRWVHNNIATRLIRFLEKISQEKNQNLLRWALETLGLISRLYPSEGRESLNNLFESAKEFLSDKVIGVLEIETVESCVKAILHLGYHLQAQVAMFFVDWTPPAQLNPTLREHMEDFVGTRGRKHAEITSNVARMKENKQKKMKGVHRGRNRR